MELLTRETARKRIPKWSDDLVDGYGQLLLIAQAEALEWAAEDIDRASLLARWEERAVLHHTAQQLRAEAARLRKEAGDAQ